MAERQMYRLKNRNEHGARVVYDANRLPVHLGPGEEKEVLMTETMVKTLRLRDSYVVARPMSQADRPVPTARMSPPREPRDQQARVVIPDNWRDLDWPQLLRLAASVSDTPIKRRADAEAAIETELERRAAG